MYYMATKTKIKGGRLLMRNEQINDTIIGLEAVIGARMKPCKVQVMYSEISDTFLVTLKENRTDFTSIRLVADESKTISDYTDDFKYCLDTDTNVDIYVAPKLEKFIDGLLEQNGIDDIYVIEDGIFSERFEYIPISCIQEVVYNPIENILKLTDMDIDIHSHVIDLESGEYVMIEEDFMDSVRLNQLEEQIDFLRYSKPFGFDFRVIGRTLKGKFNDDTDYFTLTNIDDIECIEMIGDRIYINLLADEDEIDCLQITQHGVEC